jgi:hypothetical protein
MPELNGNARSFVEGSQNYAEGFCSTRLTLQVKTTIIFED